MATPLSPTITLATSVHAQPGVYALLLGSGVSQASGIPTGWGVIQDLIRKVATLEHGADRDAVAGATQDPEAWWLEHHGEKLGYSTLLATLATTPAARQGLLAPYFEPPSTDDTDIDKQPTRAHRAIAQLAKRGYIKVIITTNFDRLLEVALSEVGIGAQVAARPEAVAGLQPLAHAPATIIKIHGDYRDIESLNTSEELSEYAEPWKSVLGQIFEQYGLVISGWSAEWDVALVRELEAASSRRYPIFWDSHSGTGPAAQKFANILQASIVPCSSADGMFAGLLANIEALTDMQQESLSVDLKIAKLKRCLPAPSRRIELYDLINSEIKSIRTHTETVATRTQLGSTGYDKVVAESFEHCSDLLQMLSAGVFHDDGTHEALWVRTLQTLLNLRTPPSGSYSAYALALQHLPAQLAFFTMGAVLVNEHRDALLTRLAFEPTWQEPYNASPAKKACKTLGLNSLLNFDLVQSLPRWNNGRGGNWLYPQSHLARELIDAPLSKLLDDISLPNLFDDLEYRIAVLQWLSGSRNPQSGEYLSEGSYDSDGTRTVTRRLLVDALNPSMMTAYTSSQAPSLAVTLSAMEEKLQRNTRW